MGELDSYQVDALTLAREVVKVAAEMPEHVYVNVDSPLYESNPFGDNGCSYSHKDGTGCILGTAMRRLGKPLPTKDELSDSESETYYLINGYVTSGSWEQVITGPDARRLVNWMGIVQRAQDRHASWSQAVADANASDPIAARLINAS